MPSSPTVGDLAGFSIQQEAALSVCEARKDAAVSVLDAINAMLKRVAETPRRRWLGIF